MMTRTLSVIAGTSLGLNVPGISANDLLPNLFSIEGYCNGVAGTQYWLQLHTVAAPSTGVTVPLRSWQIIGLDGYTFNKNDIGIQLANITSAAAQAAGTPTQQPTGFYIVLSSTDAVFTTPGITADINVELEEWELEATGLTEVTAGAGIGFSVVADGATTTNRLVKLQVTETNGAATFIQLFAKGLAFNGVPIESIPIAANATVVLNFGVAGRPFFQQDASGTGHFGIYVAFSLTPLANTQDGSCSASAWYK
jgi:hypothetical protein